MKTNLNMSKLIQNCNLFGISISSFFKEFYASPQPHINFVEN
jgi:hypothetical protein